MIFYLLSQLEFIYLFLSLLLPFANNGAFRLLLGRADNLLVESLAKQVIPDG